MILLPYIHEPYRVQFVHPTYDDSDDPENNRNNLSIDPEYGPIQTCIFGTPFLDTSPASKLISHKYFNILDDEMNHWVRLSCAEEYRSAPWCVKHNLS